MSKKEKLHLNEVSDMDIVAPVVRERAKSIVVDGDGEDDDDDE